MFWPVLTCHSSGRVCASAIPDALGPPNDGHAPAAAVARDGGPACEILTKFRAGFAITWPNGSQLLPSHIICRTLHSSATIAINTRWPSTLARYLPGPSQSSGALAMPLTESAKFAPSFFQLPLSLGQSLASSVNVPAGSKRKVNAPNDNALDGNEAAAF